jgi:hypothetical protein
LGKKYRVEQNGQFLGNHSGHTPQDAIHKAMQGLYGQIYKPNLVDDFICYKGKDIYTINLGGESNHEG